MKPDIWMPLYIGDYLAATAHLDAQESGAYLHLLMHSWKNGALPKDSEALRRIARIPKDAWSNAWAVLKDFFDFAEDGTPHQRRLEQIRGEWTQKQEKQRDKAKKAADARWERDAPSIPQAMHKPCPSSSPIPTPKVQKPKPSAAPKGARFEQFREAFEKYFLHKNNLQAPWDGQEASHLSRFLKKNPTFTTEQWRMLLQNRARSDVAHAESLSTWISRALTWANEPTKKGVFNGKSNTESKHDRAQASTERVLNGLLRRDSDLGVAEDQGGRTIEARP